MIRVASMLNKKPLREPRLLVIHKYIATEVNGILDENTDCQRCAARLQLGSSRWRFAPTVSQLIARQMDFSGHSNGRVRQVADDDIRQRIYLIGSFNFVSNPMPSAKTALKFEFDPIAR